ncbi:MAG: response regulator transcription factor [Anaerolineales bacterium]|nr:response regulator transcription factor [Anaerolineales bacterium]
MVAWKSSSSFEEINTVLIISQDAKMTEVWETLFLQKNCHVVCETTDRNAVQTSRLLSPALIVLELALPRLDLVRLCSELRDTTNGTILLLAPKGNLTEISDYLRAGADEFLSTPISPMALLIKSMAWLVKQSSQLYA